MSIKRYSESVKADKYGMTEASDGEYVRASDYDALANSGALVPVRIECVPGEHADWYMTPVGLGCLAYDLRGHEYIDTPGHIYDVNDADCHPVRLVPIAEWEAER